MEKNHEEGSDVTVAALTMVGAVASILGAAIGDDVRFGAGDAEIVDIG